MHGSVFRRLTALLAASALAASATALVDPAGATASGAAVVQTHHVRGTVSAEGGGVEEFYLDLTDDDGNTVASSSTTTGSYDLVVPDGGPYVLEVQPEPNFHHATQYYARAYFRSEATPITVAGSDVTLEPMVLRRVTEVGGIVVAEGEPVREMRVTAYPDGPGVTTYSNGFSTATDFDGSYALSLPSGAWKIRFDGYSDDWVSQVTRWWAPEWYADAASFAAATSVVVPATTDLGTATLSRGGSIAGQVTDEESGRPVRKLDVEVFDADGMVRGRTATRNDGRYTLGRLASGPYTVRVEDRQAHAFVTEYYSDADTASDATPVTVVADHTTNGVDLALARTPAPDPASIDLSGVVTDQAGVPVRGVQVAARSSCEQGASSRTWTDLDGRYAFTDLDQPRYRLWFTDGYAPAPDNYADDSFELMSGWLGGADSCYSSPWADRGSTTADASFVQLGGISGTILTETGQPPTRGEIYVYREEDGYAWENQLPGSDGSWSLGNLPPGTYQVEFRDHWNWYVPSWWQDVTTRDLATEITVLPGVMYRNVDGHVWNPVRDVERPVISGDARVGSTLSTTRGTFTGRQLSYSYQWWSELPYGQGSTMVGTGTTYSVQPSDSDRTIRVEVTASGPDGTWSSWSDPVGPVPPPPPSPPPPSPPPPVPAAPTPGTSAQSAPRIKATAVVVAAPSGRRTAVRLTASIKVRGVPVTGGTVTVTERGRTRARNIRVRRGQATLLIPRVTEGTHTYVVSYSGADGVLPGIDHVRVRVP